MGVGLVPGALRNSEGAAVAEQTVKPEITVARSCKTLKGFERILAFTFSEMGTTGANEQRRDFV